MFIQVADISSLMFSMCLSVGQARMVKVRGSKSYVNFDFDVISLTQFVSTLNLDVTSYDTSSISLHSFYRMGECP